MPKARPELVPVTQSNIASDPRGFLAAIISSADPAVSIRERLDALKILQDLGGLPHPACKCFGPEVAEMPQSELDNHTDALLRNIILGLQGKYPFETWEPFGDPMERFPHTVAAIGTYVERVAERLAVKRQDDWVALFAAGGSSS